MLPHTILIIDDDEINRAILDNLFSDTYQIEEAENGKIGLARILANTDAYCAILLDVMMPEMNGMEVLQQLEKLELTEKIPVFSNAPYPYQDVLLNNWKTMRRKSSNYCNN